MRVLRTHRFNASRLRNLSLAAVLAAGTLPFVCPALDATEPGRWPKRMAAARATGLSGRAAEATAEANRLFASHPDMSASFRNLTGYTPAAWAGGGSVSGIAQAVTAFVGTLGQPDECRAEAARLSTARTPDDSVAWLSLYGKAYEQLRRELLSACPRIAFVRRKAYGLRGTNGTMFAHRTDRGSAILVFDPSRPGEAPKTVFETADGFIWDLRPSADNQRLLMSYKESNDQPFHIWEIGVDGSGLRQLTRGNYHDFNPIYCPDGRIVFCSSRVESFSLCQNFLASSLYIMNADGGNMRRIDFTTLCTSAPSMLQNGSVLCTRWEYNDKNIFSWQGLWTLNPDGRRLMLYYGNTLTIPNSLYGGKQVPGTDTVLLTMAAHHHPPIGDIAVVDRRHGLENELGMRKVTFETHYVPTRGRNWKDANWGPGDDYFPWAVTDPWPLRDGLFLASFGRSPADADEDRGRFALCLATYEGVRFEVFGGENVSFFSPVSLEEKPTPVAILGEAPVEAGEGTFFVSDVYDGLEQQGVRRGQVKALRVVRQTPKKWNTEGPRFHDHYPLIGYGSYYVKENLGEVPVDESGAAYFRAPSNCELYFIALDEEGREIQRMGSVTQITTGEHVSCAGCHEDRMKAPSPAASASPRLSSPPDPIRPPSWGAGPFDYVRHVQPVWDRYCVSCHSGRTPAGNMDLSGDKTRFFNMSYDQLVNNGAVEYYYINRGPTGVFPALGTGSYVSKLTELIRSKHHDVNMDDESRRRVYAWIDSNVQYYNTWDMSRPHTCGGRDPAHFIAETGQLRPEPWFERFSTAFESRCGDCHPQFERGGKDGPHNYWFNLTRPEFSRVLSAHRPKEAGGLGIPAKRGGTAVDIPADDPVYGELLEALKAGKKALEEKPRMDMPGAVAVPQERNFGRVF